MGAPCKECMKVFLKTPSVSDHAASGFAARFL